ncbi:MAG TPA: twin-arginine translocation signal domain-containing protein, partial [Opitutaceae bacterium]|nr:twin-arginine translocation signal domain-containing protein [Opitutaceae bacterium]
MSNHGHHDCCGFSTNPADYVLTRRQFLNRVGLGMGALSLAAMLNPMDLFADGGMLAPSMNPMAPRLPPLP